MNRLFRVTLVATLLLACIDASAQSVQYKAKVKQLLISTAQIINNFNKPNVIPTYTKLVLQSDSTLTMGQAQKLTQEYMDTRFVDLCADMFTPYYYEQFTEDELDNVINFYETDSGKRMAWCSNKLNSPEVQNVLVEKMQAGILAIALGKEVPHVTCDVPDSFMEKFDRFSQVAQFGAKTDLIINSLKSNAGNSPEAIKVYDNLKKFLNTESRGIYGTMFYMAYTEDDMDILIAHYNTPEGKKLQEMANTISACTMEIGAVVVKDLQEWIKQYKKQ